MADITMCYGEGCPKKDTCYRYKAIPNPYWQSVFIKTPYEDGQCEHYWEDKDAKDTKTLMYPVM